jgi:hypothetical protein
MSPSGIVLDAFGRLFAIQNVDGNTPLRRRANDRPKCVRDAPAATDNLSQVVGMNDQLDHRLRAFVHEELDRDVFGIRDELAGEKREQFRCAPVSGPRIT